MAMINSRTNRPAFSGPGGQPGYPISDPSQATAGQQVWQLPDGSGQWVAYDPNAEADWGNVEALESVGYWPQTPGYEVEAAPPPIQAVPTGSSGAMGSVAAPGQATTPTSPTAGNAAPGATGSAASAAPVAEDPNLARLRQAASAYGEAFLAEYGLEDLLPLVKSLVEGGIFDSAYIAQQIRATPQHKARFIGNAGRVAAGLVPLDEATYVSNEAAYAAADTRLGITVYGSTEQQRARSAQQIGLNVSPVEYADRITAGVVSLRMAAPEVRDFYDEMNGLAGISEGDLVAGALDPKVGLPELQKRVDTAVIGGTASQFGFDFNVSTATRAVEAGVTQGQAQRAFGEIGELDPLFQELGGERTDLTAAGTGVEATLFGTAAAQAQIRRRREARQSSFEGGGGVALGQGGAAFGGGR